MNERIVYNNANVSANWETLLNPIIEVTYKLVLPNDKADIYNFSNVILMQAMCTWLVEALQARRNIQRVVIGSKFFETMNEQDQWSFFLAIFALPPPAITKLEASYEDEKPEITISTVVLLDALTALSPHCTWLSVSNFALSNWADVQTMSTIILAKCQNLGRLHLKGIECPIDYNKCKQDDDGPVGFLDPLLHASSQLQAHFWITTWTQPSYSSLVSTNAVHALFNAGTWKGLQLCHCLAIAEALQTANMEIIQLDLRQNPQINA